MIRRLRGSIPGVRWVEPDLAHFTMAFLGEQPDPQRAGAALARAAAAAPAFRAKFGAPGVFDSWDRPRIIWLGLTRGAEAMALLAEAVREELSAESVSFDPKPFVPHLTLGRVKSRAPDNLHRSVEDVFQGADLPEMRFETAEIAVSKTGPSGSVYSIARRERLGRGQT